AGRLHPILAGDVGPAKPLDARGCANGSWQGRGSSSGRRCRPPGPVAEAGTAGPTSPRSPAVRLAPTAPDCVTGAVPSPDTNGHGPSLPAPSPPTLATRATGPTRHPVGV